MQKIELASIRAQNIKKIFEVAAQKGPVTRGYLAEQTGLSLMTVSNVVGEMIRNQALAIHSKRASKTVGRKAELVTIVPDSRAILVLDLTEIAFSHQVMGLQGKVLYSAPTIPTDMEAEYGEALRGYLQKVKEELAETGYAEKLVGIGVSVPGPYREEEDTVFTQLIPEMNGLHLKAMISEIFGGKVLIHVESDVKFAARMNLTPESDNENETLAYVYIGNGVGGAFLVDGKILTGAHSMAGEIGQMRIGIDDLCADDLARRFFLESLGISTEDCNCDWRKLLLDKREAEPEKVEAALEEAADNITELCYILNWMLDPNKILLECDYAQTLDEHFECRVQKKLQEKLKDTALQAAEISVAAQGLRYAYLGATQVLTEEWLETLATRSNEE